jgi:hypothetical protein
MYGMFTAETAILLHFKPVRIVLPVLHRIIISLPAIIARERYPYAHRPALPAIIPFPAKKKNLLRRSL